MIISQYVKSRCFSYDTEAKTLVVDASSESAFSLDTNDVRSLMSFFKFISDNKMLE